MEPLHTQQLDIREAVDYEGVVRVTVFGELDIATGDILQDRLNRLGEAGFAVELDLSALRFIDATGLRAVIHGVAEANRRGWPLQVDHHLSHSVARLLELTGVADCLWLPGRARQTIDGLQAPRCLRRPAEHSARRPAEHSARRLRGSGGRPPYDRRPSIRPGH